MYISCRFHVVCASFSALATRELADANLVSSGIWALDERSYRKCPPNDYDEEVYQNTKSQTFFKLFKPIFHWNLGLRWAPNANEIYTKK